MLRGQVICWVLGNMLGDQVICTGVRSYVGGSGHTLEDQDICWASGHMLKYFSAGLCLALIFSSKTPGSFLRS